MSRVAALHHVVKIGARRYNRGDNFFLLNLKRANAFLEYYKNGTGANPLAAFLKEQAAG